MKFTLGNPKYFNFNNLFEISLNGALNRGVFKILIYSKLGELVGTQQEKAEHAIFENHFERRASSTKRLHNARAKTCAEDHATPF